MKEVNTFRSTIFISGPLDIIEQCCREYCRTGLCVTVTPTKFIYTGGEETGAEIGLINYPRFPSSKDQIRRHAKSLAVLIQDRACQDGYTIVDGDKTVYDSLREESKMTIPKLLPGYERQWVKCDKCGNVAYYDYKPYSLSAPIMVAPCGHQDMGAPKPLAGHTRISAVEALVILKG